MIGKIYLEEAVFKFSQDGNTNGSTQNNENLSITYESVLESLDIESGFFTIRTDGWSIDSPKEFQMLFDKIKKLKHE